MPPGPRLPRFIQTIGFIFTPVTWIDSNRRRYGDVVTFRTLFDPGFVMVFSPELVKQVFRGSPHQLRAGEANSELEPVVGKRSVLLLDGDEHMRERKLLLPPFHGERMRAYETTMRDAADRAIDSWPVGEPFALLPHTQDITLDVIAEAVFGFRPGPREEELKRRLRAMIAPLGNRAGLILMAITRGRLGGTGWKSFEEARLAVDEMLLEEIAARRKETDLEEREDILSMLITSRHQDGEPMNDSDLRDELLTLLMAGHETTATALAWTFELLMRNPRVLARARENLDDNEYLDALIKEALRIRPVITGVGRVVRDEPFQLGDHVIPPGVEINPSIAGIHRRSDRYPNAKEFRPERFLEENPPDTYTWVPFGGGTRRCLGASFATFEMRVVVRRILERTELRPASRRPEKAVRKAITSTPKRGVRVIQPAPPRMAS